MQTSDEILDHMRYLESEWDKCKTALMSGPKYQRRVSLLKRPAESLTEFEKSELVELNTWVESLPFGKLPDHELDRKFISAVESLSVAAAFTSTLFTVDEVVDLLRPHLRMSRSVIREALLKMKDWK